MKKIVFTFAISLVFLIVSYDALNAHDGEPHNEVKEQSNSTATANEVVVLKESQFLFSMQTEVSVKTKFSEAITILGTVIPSSKGLATIPAPQGGRIISLNVVVGQRVKIGDVLATMEQNLSTPEQVQLSTERSRIYTEYGVSKKEFERVKSIEDIVSKKEFVAAEGRFEEAKRNKELFDDLGGNNTRKILLKSPINGVVDNFNLVPGSLVDAGQIILKVVDITKVWVEAQVYEQDREKIQQMSQYMVESTQKEFTTNNVKLLSVSQLISSSNQSMKVILEIDNADQNFKPGQFVNVKVITDEKDGRNVIKVKTSALSEIGGKPVVFIHSAPEIFTAKYISPGNSIGDYTIIEKGIDEGERVVVSGAYQIKSIFLNQ